MPIDFPNSPSVNDTFTSGGSTWVWTGTVWNTVTTAVGATGPTGPTGATGATGPTGPSAITTEGDLAVGGEAGVPTRLPIGTNGQVLSSNGTTATWTTPASGGGETLISTTTLSGASVNLTSIPGTYKDLKLVIRNFKPSSDSAGANLQVNSTAGIYGTWSTFGTANNQGMSDNARQIVSFSSNTTANGLTICHIYDYANTSTMKIANFYSASNDWDTPTNFTYRNLQITINTTSAISSIQILPSSGNFTSGTVLLYGVS